MPLSCVERVPYGRVRADEPDIDPLTGLPRADALARWIRDAGQPLALILFDLDGLRRVNRSYGYAAGDRMLVSTAERLTRIARSEARVARLEGDRFGVLVMDAEDLADVSGLIERAFSVLAVPRQREGEELSIGVSAGVALMPWHAATASGLLVCADLALAEAKRLGGGCCRLFEESMRPARPMTASVREELARACRIVIGVEVPEHPDIFKPTAVRHVHALVVDILATLVAQRRGAVTRESLRRIRSALASLLDHPGSLPVGD